MMMKMTMEETSKSDGLCVCGRKIQMVSKKDKDNGKGRP